MDSQTVVRPSTPNMVMYDDEVEGHQNAAKVSNTIIGQTASRPGTGKATLAPPDAVVYQPPEDTAEDTMSVGTAGMGIWTIEGDTKDNMSHDIDEENGAIDEDDTKVLLNEFDDYHEDRVHKSAGPVVFVSKTLGMLPVIWTEDESESECKSYFNLYTFVIFIGTVYKFLVILKFFFEILIEPTGWVGLSVVSGLRMKDIGDWPGELIRTPENMTDPKRFLTKSSIDTYLAATWVASLIALLFGVFKCRSFAEVLFGLSETDAQLELQEKHYDKIKRKSLYWIVFLLILLALHTFAFYTILNDSNTFDLVFFIADLLAHSTIFVLDLQFLHFSMVLCKRYRLVNKILLHITKPWKTFRNDQPPNYVLQNILQYRFDQFFDPGADCDTLLKQDHSKKDVPLNLLIKGPEDQKVSKEEENTFILQLDILRGIHADLSAIAHEVNHLLGFQILIQIITSVIFVVMFGYFFSAAMMDEEFYWPYLVLFILPAVRIFLVGHWGQVLEQQSRQPFMTICQVSTVDGSPRLERQVQKLTIQMHHQCPTFTAAGYFNLGRNMILKTIGVAVVFTFFMVKFQSVSDLMNTMEMVAKKG